MTRGTMQRDPTANWAIFWAAASIAPLELAINLEDDIIKTKAGIVLGVIRIIDFDRRCLYRILVLLLFKRLNVAVRPGFGFFSARRLTSWPNLIQTFRKPLFLVLASGGRHRVSSEFSENSLPHIGGLRYY